jgi:hypothetical protein
MDRTENYKQVLTKVIHEYEQHPPSVGEMHMWSVCDDHQGHYSLFYAGWNEGKRTQGTPFFARVADGEIHIEHDGLGHGITQRLVAAGVTREDIVLAFAKPPVPEPVG